MWAWHAFSLLTATEWAYVLYSLFSASGWRGRVVIAAFCATILLALAYAAVYGLRHGSSRSHPAAKAQITELRRPVSLRHRQEEEAGDAPRISKAA
jgi:hypothetical protein